MDLQAVCEMGDESPSMHPLPVNPPHIHTTIILFIQLPVVDTTYDQLRRQLVA